MEAVLPIELEVPSLRVMTESGLEEVEWLSGRFVGLMLFDERRLCALYHVQGYQRRIAQAFNKKVKSRGLVERDMVTKEICAPMFDSRGKFRPMRSGPYIIKTILSRGAVKLIDLDAIPRPYGKVWHFRLKDSESPTPLITVECLSVEIGDTEVPSTDTVVLLRNA
ncbi:uncharacterized protein LOC131306814 [Rhododendron vialii]|uniref:uncharacterized protein LOC131306814 n=1 Tax=Rhododendron vialii TaxID=182163 RepID=UPI00265FA203|nr:uncharacterized protein LOC131306814 [Rhododendron vialii]